MKMRTLIGSEKQSSSLNQSENNFGIVSGNPSLKILTERKFRLNFTTATGKR